MEGGPRWSQGAHPTTVGPEARVGPPQPRGGAPRIAQPRLGRHGPLLGRGHRPHVFRGCGLSHRPRQFPDRPRAVDKGYHPCVVAPGYEMYYFTILAGKSQRPLVQYFQPEHAWQVETIPGIKDMIAKFK